MCLRVVVHSWALCCTHSVVPSPVSQKLSLQIPITVWYVGRVLHSPSSFLYTCDTHSLTHSFPSSVNGCRVHPLASHTYINTHSQTHTNTGGPCTTGTTVRNSHKVVLFKAMCAGRGFLSILSSHCVFVSNKIPGYTQLQTLLNCSTSSATPNSGQPVCVFVHSSIYQFVCPTK